MQKFWKILASYKSVNSIDVSGTLFSDTDFANFAQILHPNLKSINMDGCFPEGTSALAYKLLTILAQNSTLETISFNGNGTLSDHKSLDFSMIKDAKWMQGSKWSVLKQLLQASGIDTLSIGANQDDSYTEDLLEAISNTGCITTLSLKDISNIFSQKIFKHLNAAKGVKKLHLVSFDNEDLESTTISDVSFKYSTMTADCLGRLASMLPHNKSIVKIDLAGSLEGGIPCNIWNNFIYSIMDTPSIRKIDIDRNATDLMDSQIEFLKSIVDCRTIYTEAFSILSEQTNDFNIDQLNDVISCFGRYFIQDPKTSVPLLLHIFRVVFKNYQDISYKYDFSVNEFPTYLLDARMNDFKIGIESLDVKLDKNLREQFINLFRSMLETNNINKICPVYNIPKWYSIIYPNIKGHS